MVRGVTGVQAFQAVAKATAGVAPTAVGGASFEDAMRSGVESVEGVQRSADDALELLATGERVDLHGTMIELEKADIALRTMVSVRDKVIAAYEQVMNMAI